MKADNFIESFETRIKNSFKRHGVFSIEQLLEKTEEDILDFSWIGIRSLEKIKIALDAKGFYLKKEENNAKLV